MSRQVLYVAAPLRPTEEEIADVEFCERGERTPGPRARAAVALRVNLDRAMRWLSWLRRSFPEATFIAPWIASVLAGADDTDPAQREAGFTDDCAVIERCDGIVLCGRRISEGMRREMEHGLRRGLDDSCEPHIQTFKVYDVTQTLLALPHPEAAGAPHGRAFQVWYDQVCRR
ncbi:MAG: hypothetical protein V4515_07035 [Chloroflexota bacterium]